MCSLDRLCVIMTTRTVSSWCRHGVVMTTQMTTLTKLIEQKSPLKRDFRAHVRYIHICHIKAFFSP